MRYDIIIIGAGTSAGFLLAFLAENHNTRKLKILLLDKNKEPFKKILASGNGRCNFSNINITRSSYTTISGSQEWADSVFEAVSAVDLADYFNKRGIPSHADEFGRLMPYTNSAKTVHDFFCGYLKFADNEFENYSEVSEIKKQNGSYSVKWKHKKDVFWAESDIVVYACGGAAYPQLGTDGSSFKLLKRLGHSVTKLLPGIVPVETKEKVFFELAGLKMECALSVGGYRRKGEVLFTKYGLSGPNILYASNIISSEMQKGPVKIMLDFLCEDNFGLDYFRGIYGTSREKSVYSVFGGVLSKDFLRAFLKHFCLNESLLPGHIENVYKAFKNVEFRVEKLRPFKEAQVSLGGVFADEVDPFSFESKLNKNFYILGEALDYTGQCGGYNIHLCAATALKAAGKIAVRS